jgi:hypothetical protein
MACIATAAAMFIVPAASADVLGTPKVAAPAASRLTVVVTPANRPDPYDAIKVGDPLADQQNSEKRARSGGT